MAKPKPIRSCHLQVVTPAGDLVAVDTDRPVVLIVDDQAIDRRLLKGLLETGGYVVREASSGAEALAAAQVEPPQIVISDILMPGMDGFTLCHEWMRDAKLRNIPFLFCTANGEHGETLGRQLGAVGYLTKPLSAPLLLDKVEAALAGARSIHVVHPADAADGEAEGGLAQRLETSMRELKQAYVALALKEAEYRLLFSNNPLPIWVYDLESLHFLAVNEAAVRHYGYSEAEFLAMGIADIRPGEEVPRLLDNVARVSEGLDEAGLWRHRKKDGTLIDVKITSHTLTFNGRRAEMVVAQDVTDRIEAEAQMILDDLRLSALLDLSEKAATLGEREIAQMAVEELVRLTQSQVGCMHFFDAEEEGSHDVFWPQVTLKFCDGAPDGHFPAEMADIWAECARQRQPVVHNDFKAWLRERKGFESRTDLVRHLSVPVMDGKRVAAILGVANKPQPYDDSDVRQARLIGASVWNLIQRKLQLEALEEQEAKFRVLVEQSLVGIFIVVDGQVAYANPQFAAIFGARGDEISGRTFLDLLAEEYRGQVADGLLHCLGKKGCSMQMALKGLRRDGESIDLDVHGSAATYQGWPAVIGVLQDVSARRRAEEEVTRYVARLERSMHTTIEAIAHIEELRDPYTSGHERRVGDLAAAIGKEMGMSDDAVRGLRVIGYLHDVGKIALPAEILARPGHISDIEYSLIQQHCREGYEILKKVEFPWPVALAVLQHHERLDGSGYPIGLRGNDILIEARIIAVADVVEAIASHRPYRPALGLDVAFEEISRNAGVIFDPDVVSACLRLFKEHGYSLPIVD
jgi:PAS domain S-box-containing protein